ncbi:MAG: hypothetical protein KGL95_08190 [Patescibacteria group bacterium]|nr:hypothetical protein [Patescibacteria group bacterium]
MKILYLAIILCTSALLASSAYLQLDKQQAQLSKEQCMGGSACPGATPLPVPNIGNRTLEVELELYQNSTDPTGAHLLWLRFLDARTNQTLHHISFFLTITSQNQLLFRELLHTHTGILDLDVIPTNGTTWTVQGAREPILNGWVPPNPTAPLIIHANLFDYINATYRLNIQMFTLDNDNLIFTANAPSPPTFDLYLNMSDQGKMMKTFLTKENAHSTAAPVPYWSAPPENQTLRLGPGSPYPAQQVNPTEDNSFPSLLAFGTIIGGASVAITVFILRKK